MLRLLYRVALALHPPAFRKRFADEMLSIFECAQKWPAKLRLLADAFLSLARQWALRPEFWHENPSAIVSQPVSDSLPSFLVLDPFRPRTYAVIHGLLVSTAVFCLTCFAIRYSSIHILHVRIPRVLWDEPSSIQPSVSPSELRSKIESAGQAIPLPAASPAIPAAISMNSPSIPQVKTDASLAVVETKSQVAAASGGPGTVSVIPEGKSESYVGVYKCHSPEVTITITMDNGSLAMEVEGQPKRALAPISSARFVVVDAAGIWVEFDRDKTGTIRRLQLFQDGRLLTANRR